jgi:hypothetical protein
MRDRIPSRIRTSVLQWIRPRADTIDLAANRDGLPNNEFSRGFLWARSMFGLVFLKVG